MFLCRGFAFLCCKFRLDLFWVHFCLRHRTWIKAFLYYFLHIGSQMLLTSYLWQNLLLYLYHLSLDSLLCSIGLCVYLFTNTIALTNVAFHWVIKQGILNPPNLFLFCFGYSGIFACLHKFYEELINSSILLLGFCLGVWWISRSDGGWYLNNFRLSNSWTKFVSTFI